MATIESPTLVQLTFLIQCPIFMIKDTEISALKFRRIKAGIISKFRYTISLLIYPEILLILQHLNFS